MACIVIQIPDDAPEHTATKMLAFLHASAGGYTQLSQMDMISQDMVQFYSAMANALRSAEERP